MWTKSCLWCFGLNSERNKDMQVVMGGLSLDMEETTEQTLNVEEVIVHEGYRDTSAAVYNDIGYPCPLCIIEYTILYSNF